MIIMKNIIFYSCITILCCQCKVSNLASTNNRLTASITRQGYINCFDSGLLIDNQPVWCEASAILYNDNKIFFANDKDMPGIKSSLFYWTFQDDFIDTTQSPIYSTNGLLKHAKKFEDFALTPNQKYVFLTTGFDRVQPNSNSWDNYNTVLYWETGDDKNPKVLSINGTDSTSVCYRDKISKALTSVDFPQGAPYFKIEGLAATDDMLYWGVREEGKKFDDFSYKIKILVTPYKFDNGKVTIGDFKVFSNIDIASVNPSNHSIAISSIEYDRFRHQFFILTSYEEKEVLGGYLWTATLSELQNGKINLVKDTQGVPIEFHNKCEDLAIINKNKLIIIHDDDRNKTVVNGQVRQLNQAAYSIVEFK